jgi:arylsulfatase A-like enzyme
MLVLSAATTFPVSVATSATAAEAALPNVVIIVSDDQPKGVLDAMPTVENELAAKGLTLTNGIIPTSVCCPSRASLLTGNYAHTTGVYGDTVASHGGWPTFYRDGAGPAE